MGWWSDQTPAEFADHYQVSVSSVYRWIRQGELNAVRRDGRLTIPFDEKTARLSLRLPRKAYVPRQLRRYEVWHRNLDELVWLLKVCYTPKESVKRKRFRLDEMFANYIVSNEISIRSIKRELCSSTGRTHRTKVQNDLKRGWYSELAYCIPLRPSTLGLSFSDISLNQESSLSRFAFPSWKIIEAYYCSYFYLRSVTLAKCPNVRLERHAGPIRALKECVLAPLSRTLWKFPLDISYIPKKRINRRHYLNLRFPHLRFGFSAHPRPPHSLPWKLAENVASTYRRLAKRGGRPTQFMLLDFLRSLRVWANYINIDDLLSLWGPGYKSFMDQNLAVVLFFVGGIAEIAALSTLGERSYLSTLQSIHDEFCVKNPLVRREFRHTPLYQRLVIYKRLGLVKGDIQFPAEEDINAVELNGSQTLLSS